MPYVVRPIGIVRSPLSEKVSAPRQARVGEGIAGTIEIAPELEHAVSDLEGFDRIWVLFWFDRAAAEEGEGVRTKVLPPRSDRRRGVFATRSPHRPNPIGLSAVRLVRVEGLRVVVRDLDLLEGTPVLDLKPYLPYADAFPDAGAGWLEARDPLPAWEVTFAEAAREALAWIAVHDPESADFEKRLVETLALGPQPHPYRRIKKVEGAQVIAVKAWRAQFSASDRRIVVERIRTGYRGRDLAVGEAPEHAVHRAFAARFG